MHWLQRLRGQMPYEHNLGRGARPVLHSSRAVYRLLRLRHLLPGRRHPEPAWEFIPRVKPKDIPKAEVIKELCTGCEFCVDICPFECIHMIEPNDETVANHYKIAFVEKNKCVACRLCESVCDKDAIVVPEAPTQLKGYLPDFVVAGTGR